MHYYHQLDLRISVTNYWKFKFVFLHLQENISSIPGKNASYKTVSYEYSKRSGSQSGTDPYWSQTHNWIFSKDREGGVIKNKSCSEVIEIWNEVPWNLQDLLLYWDVMKQVSKLHKNQMTKYAEESGNKCLIEYIRSVVHEYFFRDNVYFFWSSDLHFSYAIILPHQKELQM